MYAPVYIIVKNGETINFFLLLSLFIPAVVNKSLVILGLIFMFKVKTEL